MESYTVIKENWFTRPAQASASLITTLLTASMMVMSFLYWSDLLHGAALFTASRQAVFSAHHYYRAWTTLFVHADLAHFLSNILLFIPLAYALSAHFDKWLFPVFGFAVGGVINLFVLKTLPLETTLVGASGVVYWMGATWLTLYVLIENRDRLRRRLAKAMIATLVLFFPQTYHAEVSYLSHFLGFIFGVVSGSAYYWWKRETFARAIVTEQIWEDEEIFESADTQIG